MQIKTLKVNFLFHENKLDNVGRPDVAQQEAIIQHLNAAMDEWNANIIDIDVSASVEKA